MNSAARWLVGLGIAAVGACASAQTAPKPLLWRVSDADNEVYLLGSFHALKPSDYPLGATVELAFADAERVAFELSPDEMRSPELPRKMMAAATFPKGTTLRDSIPGGTWRKLEDYAFRRGVPVQNFAGTEAWMVSLLISMQELMRLGYDPAQGLDQHMMARSASARKPTMGLETGEEQITALDGMSAAEQQQSLEEALGDADDFKAKMDQLHAYWRAGNVQKLDERLSVEFKRDYARLYQRINVDRNQAWLPKIRRMLDQEARDDTLVVVGTMHLIGPDGLVSQLESRGYRVERL